MDWLRIFGMTLLLALGLSGTLIPLARRWLLVDHPGHRKTHRQPIAYLGGLAIFVALATVLLALRDWLAPTPSPSLSVSSLNACLWPALAAAGLGLWDDVFELRARYKLFGQAVVAVAFSLLAYRFHAFHLPGFIPWALDPVAGVLVTTFFILAVVNGFNMIDGSDGLCAVSSAVTLGMVAWVAARLGQPHFSLLAVSGSGACLGFFFWNRSPARMYLGDAGSHGLGFLVACLLVALGSGDPGLFQQVLPNGRPWQPYNYQVVLAVLLAGYPALEVGLTVLRRILQGRALGRGDQGHIHHHLQRVGFTAGWIVAVAVVVNLLSGGIVLAFLATERGLAVLLSLLATVVTVVGLQQLGYTRFLRRRWLEERRPHYAIATHFAAMQTAKLELARDIDEALSLVAQACQELGVHECRITLRSDTNGRRWTWTWSAPEADVRAETSRADRIRLPQSKSHAAWTLDLDGREPELDMNLRVIMSEFMQRALQKLGLLLSKSHEAASSSPGKGGEMSVGKLKSRL